MKSEWLALEATVMELEFNVITITHHLLCVHPLLYCECPAGYKYPLEKRVWGGTGRKPPKSKSAVSSGKQIGRSKQRHRRHNKPLGNGEKQGPIKREIGPNRREEEN